MYMVRKTMFSHQTGQIPIQSLCGNKYIMVIVEIDSKAILVEPIKNRKDAKMIRADNALLLQLKQASIVPKKHVLDNEVSENMKDYICVTCKLDMELVPPGCHICNAAKVAIHNFKTHFLSILAGGAGDFPPNLWDWLLPQFKITINLIQQSNATPNDSAYAHLSGPFHYNEMPLALMGCKAQVPEKYNANCGENGHQHLFRGIAIILSPLFYDAWKAAGSPSPITTDSNNDFVGRFIQMNLKFDLFNT
jgi:hypothetical protein